MFREFTAASLYCSVFFKKSSPNPQALKSPTHTTGLMEMGQRWGRDGEFWFVVFVLAFVYIDWVRNKVQVGYGDSWLGCYPSTTHGIAVRISSTANVPGGTGWILGSTPIDSRDPLAFFATLIGFNFDCLAEPLSSSPMA